MIDIPNKEFFPKLADTEPIRRQLGRRTGPSGCVADTASRTWPTRGKCWRNPVEQPLLANLITTRYNPGMARKQRFSDQLRRAIKQSELSRYRISKRTGIAQSILSRYLSRGAGLSIDSIDKLCDCLGLRLMDEGREQSRKGK